MWINININLLNLAVIYAITGTKSVDLCWLASARSKGGLLVSAIDPIKNIINKGNKGNINQTALCDSTLTVKFKLPVNKTTNSMAELSINS